MIVDMAVKRYPLFLIAARIPVTETINTAMKPETVFPCKKRAISKVGYISVS